MREYIVKNYCSLCNAEHEVEVSSMEENIVIKGSQITYDRKSYYCSIKQKYFVTDELMDENIEAAYDKYNNIHQANYIGSGLHLLKYL